MKFLLLSFLLCHAVSIRAAIPQTAADGQTDDTVPLQNAIDHLPPFGVLDGGGATYLTGTLNLKANMTMQNFHLISRPASASSVPINVDGSLTPISNVTIKNVNVDGNRHYQTNLAAPEDGARDCFRIAGVATNIWILNSSAHNCATDGLKIFSAAIIPPANQLNFTNIYVLNSSFTNNRRHGISLDSLRNAMFVNTITTGNGLAVGTGAAEGDRPFLVNGILFASGIDVEGYVPGGAIDGVNFIGCTSTGNARFGIDFWESTPANTPGFARRSNIRIESSVLDGGVSANSGHQAIEFNVPPPNLKLGIVYQNVILSNNIINGTVIANAVDGFGIIGGQVNSPYAGFYGIAQHTSDIVTQFVSAGGKILVQQ